MKSNKKLVVVISIVLALAVASAVVAYFYLMTDVFKSSKELFAKYFSQNTEVLEKLTDLQTIKIYENLKNEDKYESNTNIEIIHSEGGEVSDPLNNLTAKIDVQKDGKQYFYADGKILYEDEEYLEAEVIKEDEQYGVRFTNAVKQFVTLEKDDKIETIANEIGVKSETIGILMNVIDGAEETSISGNLTSLKEKYLNIITTAISNGTFSNQKKAMITYNNSTTETNAYSVELTSEQVRSLVLEILNNTDIDVEEAISWVNEQTEMPIVKITVYVREKQVIRTVADVGLYKITIENTELQGEIKTNINILNNNDSVNIEAEMIKSNTNEEENLEISIDVEDGEESYTIAFESKIKQLEKQKEFVAKISHKKDITSISIELENKVDIVNDLERVESLDSNNNIVLNTAPDAKRKEFIDILKQLVQQETNVRIELLKRRLQMINEEEVDPNQTTQVEINKFNSKFEFYTGDEVSAENVKSLLDIMKNHLAGYENIIEQTEENVETDLEEIKEEDKKLNLKMNIEKDIFNEKATNEILEKISNTKKYKVSISYKDDNGLIDFITITEL